MNIAVINAKDLFKYILKFLVIISIILVLIKSIKSIDKVKYAVLETNGNLSVFNDNSDYPLPIVLDGVIDYTVLKEINKDYKWLINILKKKNLEI